MCKEECKRADESCKEDATFVACSHAKVMQGLDDGHNEKPIAATIQIDDWANHPERHGAMFDLTASEDVEFRKGEAKVIPLGIRMKLPEGYFGLLVPRSSTCLKHGIMMANSVGIIEDDYCGPGDVWGFVAYAVRGTKIAKGTRIAQFMPVKKFGDLDFNVVYRMPFQDRGGYGSTGQRHASERAGEYSYMDGSPIEVGDRVLVRENGSSGTVCGLHTDSPYKIVDVEMDDGFVTIKRFFPSELEPDERPRDYDGVPIKIGDVVYSVGDDGSPEGEPRTVAYYTCNEYFYSKEVSCITHEAKLYTHREPDSFEAIAEDAVEMPVVEYVVKKDLDISKHGNNSLRAKQADLLRRMKAVAERG